VEGHAGYYVKDSDTFFILGAGDCFAENLRKTAVRVAMRLNSSIEYLMNMPISEFMTLVEDINEADKERAAARNNRR
jgi:hypothetical protein